MKYYDGAASKTDNVPNQLGLVMEGKLHYVEAADALIGANIGKENAEAFKKVQEKKTTPTTNKE
ncbi:MAG: hypothetical protein ABL929_13155 [Ferruginibacter sp.]